MTDEAPPLVSLLLVTYNGRRHVRRLLRSLATTTGVPYEVVAVDNASRARARASFVRAHARGALTSLTLLGRNTLFSPGVNTAARVSDQRSRYVLLLNPDIVIQDPTWLARLVDLHERGATALGFVEGGPVPRADGYCLLVDRDLWDEHGGLSEDYHWWWAVTKFQADLLVAGHRVAAVADHEDVLHHVGGGSGAPPTDAKGMSISPEDVVAWFGGHQVTRVERLP